MHHDGLYGLYRRMGINPDALTRSIRQEFVENDGGKWYEHFDYVVNQPAVETYPSSKGEAPGVPNDDDIRLAEPEEREEYERLKKPFTRDWRNTGKTLADFVAAQPKKESRERLSPAEVAVLRLYTGPMHHKYNLVLRSKSATPCMLSLCQQLCADNYYATTIHAINSLVLTLMNLTPGGKVYRGMCHANLPDCLWEPDAEGMRCGVEYGFLSTSRENSTSSPLCRARLSSTSPPLNDTSISSPVSSSSIMMTPPYCSCLRGPVGSLTTSPTKGPS